MTQVTWRWKNQYAYEARRPKVPGLQLIAANGLYPLWQVSAGDVGGGFYVRKSFGFASYRSGAAAYRAAMEFLLTLGRLQSTKTYRRKSSNAKRPDLPVGVNFYSCDAFRRYVAFISVKGERRKASFSVSKYGEEQAKALAIAQRKAWDEEFALKPSGIAAQPRQPYENNYEVVII